eukprot:TRINITY_DN19381_c1_g1_i1.p2 TRINITY_DN19381_c1_g1~~TRINITY_DN19381_c1_g1_i1.p2  ORF type:complete len:147 (+),score=0.91 TRINITY_DN19381_c1_g1_i1:58-498(+)
MHGSEGGNALNRILIKLLARFHQISKKPRLCFHLKIFYPIQKKNLFQLDIEMLNFQWHQLKIDKYLNILAYGNKQFQRSMGNVARDCAEIFYYLIIFQSCFKLELNFVFFDCNKKKQTGVNTYWCCFLIEEFLFATKTQLAIFISI